MRLMQPARPGGQGGDERGPTGRCAFPATDGSADLRLLPPSQSAIMALRQFRFSAGMRKTLVIPRQLFCTGVPRCCPAGGYPMDSAARLGPPWLTNRSLAGC